MSRGRFIAALIACSAATAAAAGSDPRIIGRPYHASEVVTVHGGPGIESTIAFADDERIENIAVGDSAEWQVAPNKRANLLFVKPSSARSRTNMTVVTNRRTYLFDLVSGTPKSAVYMLRFSYPDAPKPTPETPVPGTANGAPVAVAAARPPQPPPTLVRHYAWRSKGDKNLLPASFFDDGTSTYLRWAKDDPIPAILARGEKGIEGPVNYTVRGDFIVVEGVPALLVLRRGKDMATLTPDPDRPVVSQYYASAAPAGSLTP